MLFRSPLSDTRLDQFNNDVTVAITGSTSPTIPVDMRNKMAANIRNEADIEFEHEFGVCLAGGPLHGSMTSEEDADWLIEWFEINRMFGVTEFYLINANLQKSQRIDNILKYYQDQKLVKQTETFYEHQVLASNSQEVKIFKSVTLNDCVYTNMYRYRYIVIIDLDEILVPLNAQTYSNLVQSVDDKRWTSLKVKARAFYMDFYTPQQQRLENATLRTTRYLKYVDDIRNKTILNPRNCIASGSHFCFLQLPGKHEMFVPQARVHHYRHNCYKKEEKESYSKQKCNMYKQQAKEDRCFETFHENLENRVKEIRNRVQ